MTTMSTDVSLLENIGLSDLDFHPLAYYSLALETFMMTNKNHIATMMQGLEAKSQELMMSLMMGKIKPEDIQQFEANIQNLGNDLLKRLKEIEAPKKVIEEVKEVEEIKETEVSEVKSADENENTEEKVEEKTEKVEENVEEKTEEKVEEEKKEETGPHQAFGDE